MTDNMTIAQTILQQLGGNKFLAMTGARDLLATDHGLRFRLPRGLASRRVNIVEVILDPDDTYTIKTGRIQRHDGVPEYHDVDFTSLVYCDTLRANFTALTGLDTSLA